MSNFFAFMDHLKDNSNFVAMTFVLSVLVGVCTITSAVTRTTLRKQRAELEQQREYRRIDAARSIVPVKRMGDDVQS